MARYIRFPKTPRQKINDKAEELRLLKLRIRTLEQQLHKELNKKTQDLLESRKKSRNIFNNIKFLNEQYSLVRSSIIAIVDRDMRCKARNKKKPNIQQNNYEYPICNSIN